MSRPFTFTEEGIRECREWRATPRHKRKLTRAGMAMRHRVSEHTLSRAANASRSYAKVTP